MPEDTIAGDKKVSELAVRVEQDDAYRFEVTFDKEYVPIIVDEPPPLGKDEGPNAARILATAIGNCLAASLVFCLGKRGVKVAHGVVATVSMDIVRTPERGLRIGQVRVGLRAPGDVPSEALEACREVFEDFCTVTASVRRGIDVSVTLEGGSR